MRPEVILSGCPARRRARVLPAMLAAAALQQACGGDEVTLITPPPPPIVTTSLSFPPDSEAQLGTTALGWPAGIPAADVVVTSDNGDPIQLRTSSQGTVELPSIPAGNLLVRMKRLLAPAEQGRLPEGLDILGFISDDQVSIPSPINPIPIAAAAARQRSLVISEWSFAHLYAPSVGGYPHGGYLELQNNANTVVYLDGILVGDAYSQAVELPPTSCAQASELTNEPRGVWGRFVYAFPGSGMQYPLQPGGVVVIATDAIDHRSFFPGAPDLSGADFEFIGTADADNPAVPNMRTASPNEPLRGHGLGYNILHAVAFVASPVDPLTLERKRVSFSSNEFLLIPGPALLDVISLIADYEFSQPFCQQQVHPQFDRGWARLIEDQDTILASLESIHRAILQPGSRYLQHTRNSARDLVVRRISPGLPLTPD